MSAHADLGFATNLSRADVSMELSQVFTYDILDWLETDDLTVPTVVARPSATSPSHTNSLMHARARRRSAAYTYTGTALHKVYSYTSVLLKIIIFML